jgi:copper(I)-binding protein
VIRPPVSLLLAGLAVLIGMAGLVRGSIPQTPAADGASSAPTAPIVVGGAYVREPATTVNAAVYFTVFNTTDTPDLLSSVVTGAGAAASLHSETASGGMKITSAGLTVPAKSSVALSPGKGHVMIEKLYGVLKAGQTVNLQLTFARAGVVLVTAPVVGLLAPAPTATGPK